jgi:copper transport protein
MMKRLLTILGLAAILLLWQIGTAAAHANLVRSTPAAGASLASAPDMVVLEFSEALDPSFSKLTIYDSASTLVEPGPGQVDPAAPERLSQPMPPVPNGTYTIRWRVRSAVDGHITEGTIPFGVGVAASIPAAFPPPGTPDPLTEAPPLPDTILRWAGLLAVLLGLGGVVFCLLIWRPATNAADSDLTMALVRATRKLTLAGAILAGVATLLFLVTQAARAAEVGWFAAIGAPVARLLAGRSGAWWLGRLALLGLLGYLGFTLPERIAGWRWWLALLAGAGVLLTFSATAHAAAVSPAPLLAIGADWLHLSAMVVWLGGLPALLALLWALSGHPDRRSILAAVVPRFSRLAIVCVLVLSLTGTYSAIIHVGRWDLLPTTTYGRALLAKLAAMALLLALGAINWLIVTPRLRAAPADAPRSLGRTVRGELILAVVVLGLVGVMTSSAPSLAAFQAHAQQGIIEQASVGGASLTLRMAPGTVGDNSLAVDVTDPRPGAAAVPAVVLIRATMQSMDMGTVEVFLETADQVRFTTRGSFLTMAGPWKLTVIVRRSGFDDLIHDFVIPLASPATQGVPALPTATPDNAAIERGGQIYAKNCTACHGTGGRGDGPASASLSPRPVDLTLHITQHDPAQIARWIATGVPGSAMPAFGTTLTPEEIQDIIAYLKTLAR